MLWTLRSTSQHPFLALLVAALMLGSARLVPEFGFQLGSVVVNNYSGKLVIGSPRWDIECWFWRWRLGKGEWRSKTFVPVIVWREVYFGPITFSLRVQPVAYEA